MRPICYDVDAGLVVWLQVNYFYGGVNQDEYNRLLLSQGCRAGEVRRTGIQRCQGVRQQYVQNIR